MGRLSRRLADAGEQRLAPHVPGEQPPQTGPRHRDRTGDHRRGTRAGRVGEQRREDARDAERQGDQGVVEREDPSPDVIGHQPLQPVA
jgi:hypothetical protein